MALAACLLFVDPGYLMPGSRTEAKVRPKNASLTTSGRLLAGKQVERSILPGSKHLYALRLNSGQYLRASIDRKQVDLLISVFGAGRSQLSAINSRRFGSTSVSWVVGASGVYELEVQAATAKGPAGRYRLSLEIHDAATPGDHDAIAAEKLFAEAERLVGERKLNSLPSAIAKYEEAIAHWRTAGRLEEVAVTLRNIGEAYLLLARNDQALEFYNQALQLSQLTGDRQLEIESLNSIGFIQNEKGAPNIARDYCNRALSLSQDVNYSEGEARALNNLGLTHYNSGDMRQALTLFKQALAIWPTANDRAGQAETLLHVGYAYDDLGETRRAMGYFNQSLSLARKTKDYRTQILSLAVLGLAYTWSGEKNRAFDSFKEAIEIAQLIGDRFSHAVSLNGIAYYYDDLGKDEAALNNYNQAALIFNEIGNHSYEAFTLGYAAHIYFALGDTTQALECYKRQLEISKSLPNPRMEAYSLRDIGAVHASLENWQEALSLYESALVLSKQVADLRGQAYILNRMGLIHNQFQRWDLAQACFDEALQLLRSVEDQSGEILTLYNIARLRRDAGELEQASAAIQNALQLIERMRANVISDDLRASYLASVYQCYELYIDVLMQMHKQEPTSGYDAAAFIVSERGRARSLLDMLMESRADIRQGIDPGLLQKRRSLQQLLNAKAERHTRLLVERQPSESASQSDGKREDKDVATLAKEIEELTIRFHDVEAEIKIKSPRYATLTQPEPLSLTQLQKLLDRNTVLLEYSLGEKRSYVWVVTRQSLNTYELPPSNEIEAAAREFGRLITARETDVVGETFVVREKRVNEADAQLNITAHRLSRMTLEPVASHLGTSRIVIVADGALQSIPFAALPDPRDPSGQAPLVVTHELSNLPSLSTLEVLRKELRRRKRAPRTLAVLADPVYEVDDGRIKRNQKTRFNGHVTEQKGPLAFAEPFTEPRDTAVAGGFKRLPFSRREAQEISRLVHPRKRKLALDFGASRRMALGSELSRYRMIHFAAHGFLNDEHPELSGIVLSLVNEYGDKQDGFLRLNEIYNLKLKADLVVLSACQTALGKYVKGEGIVGLTRGFMYSGAARVSATLWKVDDNATSLLMRRFYNEMLKGKRLKPPAALRAAQIHMMKQPQWSSPYFWAAFIMHGEWR